MNKKIRIVLLVFMVIIFGLIGGLVGVKRGSAQEKTITINSRKYAFEPEVIRANRGDKITLILVSKDVAHGLYLEGYDFDSTIIPETPHFWIRQPSQAKEYETDPVETYTFTANKIGKFRYRCSINCGSMHPFMQGELIVSPNYLFPASIGLALGIALACVLYFRKKEEQ